MPACKRDPLAWLAWWYQHRQQGNGTATHSLDTAPVGMATPDARVGMATLSLATISTVGMATPSLGCHHHHHQASHSNNADMADSVARTPWQQHPFTTVPWSPTCVVSGTPSRKPATATPSVTKVFLRMIHSLPTSSTMAVTSVSSRQNCVGQRG